MSHSPSADLPAAPESIPANWSFGMTVGEILTLPVMTSARVLAGEGGIDRVVERLNMMEVPDVLPWVRPSELLVTSGYPLRDLTDSQFSDFVQQLSRRGLAGLCIKEGRFVRTVPEAALRTADGEKFPILAMPGELAFTDLLSAVLEEQLQRQEALLRTSDEIDRLLLGILLEGGGHQEVCQQLSEWLRLPVSIADATGDVLAAWPSPPHQRLRERSSRLRLQLGALPVDEHDVVAQSASIAVACIRTSAGTQGYVLVDGGAGPILPGQVLALRRAAPVVALGFARANEIRAVQARFQGDFLRDLVLGVDRGHDDVLEQAERFGWAVEGPLLLAVINTAVAGGRDEVSASCVRIGRALSDELREPWPGAVVHSFATEVVALLPAEARATLPDVVHTVRRRSAKGERAFRMGCASLATGYLELPVGYRQAHEALRSAPVGGGPPVFFDELGLARIVSLVAESGHGRQLVADVLDPVMQDRNGEELFRTLDTFLAANCNVATTAKALHFHYNTVRYRISRLEQLLGTFVDDAERRAVLLAACRLRRAIGQTP